MSADSGKPVAPKEKGAALGFGPLAAILATIGIYFFSQLIVGILLGLFFGLSGWSESKVTEWSNSTFAQFLLVTVSGLATVGVLYLVMRWRHSSFRALGFIRRPESRDATFMAVGFFVYFGLLIAASVIARQIFGVDTEQEQDVGFEQVKTGGSGLALVFLSLVIIPPIVEEMIFRGFLFGGLRTKLSFGWATAITSVLFAAPHLLGGNSGLLWIAAVDTFVLSLVLCYVREKSGALWACIGIHAIKNSLAFLVVFVIQ